MTAAIDEEVGEAEWAGAAEAAEVETEVEVVEDQVQTAEEEVAADFEEVVEVGLHLSFTLNFSLVL